jgi:hypothetical protein
MRAYSQRQIAVFFDGRRNDAGRTPMHWICGGNLQRKEDVDVKGTDEDFPGYMKRNLE